MNKIKILEIVDKARESALSFSHANGRCFDMDLFHEKFAELILQDCIDKIETYRIPVGNSASGELACEWTYDALKEIRDVIKEDFGLN